MLALTCTGNPGERTAIVAAGRQDLSGALATTADGLAAQLAAASAALKTLLDGGQLPSMPKAAMRVKAVALALGTTGGSLPADDQRRLDSGVRRVVLEAWTLDAASDAADLAQVTHAQERLARAVDDLLALPRGTRVARPRTGPVTYGDAVFPILQTHCTPCHATGGVAPVPLLTHADASRAADAIRAQLTAQAMPPRFADPSGPAMLDMPPLSAQEIETLIEWTSTGTPAGPAVSALPTPEPSWTLGTPSHILDVPASSTATATARRAPVRVETGFTEDVWLRAADLLSPDRARLRAASVRIDGGPVVAAWLPGEAPRTAPAGTAFLLPAGRALVLEMTDGASRSTAAVQLGLYTTTAVPPAGRLTTLPVEDALTLTAPVRVLAVRADAVEPVATATVVATRPSGEAVPLLTLRGATPGWSRLYWLTTPVDLPAGTSVAVQVSGENPAIELLVTGR